MFKKNIIKILITITLATLTLPLSTTATKNKNLKRILPNDRSDNAVIIVENKKEEDKKTPESLDESNKTKENDCENKPHYKIFPEDRDKLKNVIGKDKDFLERLYKLNKNYITYVASESSDYHIYDKEPLTFHNIYGALENIFEEYDKYVRSRYEWKKLLHSSAYIGPKKNKELLEKDVLETFKNIFLKYLIFINKASIYAEEEFKTINNTVFLEYEDEKSINDTIDYLDVKIPQSNEKIKKNEKLKNGKIHWLAYEDVDEITKLEDMKIKINEISDIIKNIKESIKKQFKKIYKIIMNFSKIVHCEEYENILNPYYYKDFFENAYLKDGFTSVKDKCEQWATTNNLLNKNNFFPENKQDPYLENLPKPHIAKQFFQNNKEICKNYIVWYLKQSKKDDALDMKDKFEDYVSTRKRGREEKLKIIYLIDNILETIRTFNIFNLK